MADERISLFIQMMQHIPDFIVDRGYAYFEEDRVSLENIDDDRILAHVTGEGGNYSVRVNRRILAESECDCPYEHLCKHIVAVVYALENAPDSGDDDDSGHDRDSGIDFGNIDRRAGLGGGRDAVAKSKVASPDDTAPGSLLSKLSGLPRESVLEILTLAIERDPGVKGTLLRALLAWRQGDTIDGANGDANRDTIDGAIASGAAELPNCQAAAVYFGPQIEERLSECGDLFKRREYEHDSYDWRGWDQDDEETGEWDYSEAQEHLLQWYESLAELVRGERPIPGLAGLAMTHLAAEDWVADTGMLEGYERDTFLEECQSVYDHAFDLAIERAATEPGYHDALYQFADWVLSQCESVANLSSWTRALSTAIIDRKHLQAIRGAIAGKWPEFLTDPLLTDGPGPNETGRYLHHWWAQTCLRYDWEEEALSTASLYPRLAGATARGYADYYAAREEWQKALNYERMAVDEFEQIGTPRAEDYDRLILWCERVGAKSDAADWRRKAFGAGPSFDRFKGCLNDMPNQEERVCAARAWATDVRDKHRYSLAALMLWTIGDRDDSWRLFTAHLPADLDWDADARRFLTIVETEESARAIPIYTAYAEKAIEKKNRADYKRAAAHLQKAVYACQSADRMGWWTSYIRNLKSEFARYSALQDELRKAGL